MNARSYGVVIALLTTSTGLTACGNSGIKSTSGCDDFNPQSDPLAVGQSVPVDIEFTDGGWNTPDIAGVYWDTEARAPSNVPQNGSLPGIATLTAAQLDADGNVLEGSLRLDLAEYGEFEFIGPIFCY